jgi:hemerythrin-like domain-containing protein
METKRQEAESDPYDVLAREHRLIERVLDALGRICSQASHAGHLDVRAATLAIRFLREFADQTHHLKEERLLFPAIEANGYFPGCGLVREHEDGRARVRSMSDAIPAAGNGDPEAVRLFVRRARSFVSFLRDHIAKEDDCLADVVRSTLSPEARARLTREFDELEPREIGERALERYSAVAEEIETLCGQTGPPGPTGGAG